MNKYNGTYKVIRNRDCDGKFLDITDNYIPCHAKAQIYRYGDSALAITFQTRLYAKNRLADFTNSGIQYEELQYGDTESTYIFSESDLNKVAEIVKARKRKQYSDEYKEKLISRLAVIREKRNIRSNSEI